MKKILTILFALSCLVSYSQDTKVTAPLGRNNPLDLGYATHIDSLGKGGFMALSDTFTRNALPASVRKRGMLVSVQDTIYYRLVGGILNSNWARAYLGSDGSVLLTDSVIVKNPFLYLDTITTFGNPHQRINFNDTLLDSLLRNASQSIISPDKLVSTGNIALSDDSTVTVFGPIVYRINGTTHSVGSVSYDIDPVDIGFQRMDFIWADSLEVLHYVKGVQDTSRILMTSVPEGGILVTAFTVKSYFGVVPSYNSSGLLSGGVVSHDTLYRYDITPAIYNINNTQYSSAAGSVTLTTADATFDRIDIIALNNLGQIVVIPGVAEANPQQPPVDLSTQIPLTFIIVKAGTTAPPDVAHEIIFDENIPPPVEWTPTAAPGSPANFNDATNPSHLVKDADIFSWSGTKYLVFSHGSLLTVSDWALIKLNINLKTPLTSAGNIQVRFFNGSTEVCPSVLLTSAQGFSKTATGYQNITIPFTSLAFTNTKFNTIIITLLGSGGGFYLDYMQLQGGVINIGGTGLTNVFIKSPDSLFQTKNGINVFVGLVNQGTGNLQTVSNAGNTTTRFLNLSGVAVNNAVGKLIFNVDSANAIIANGYQAIINFDRSGGDLTLQSSVSSGTAGGTPSFGTVPLRIKPSGLLNFGNYGGNFFTGTPAYDLSVASNGDLITMPKLTLTTVAGSTTYNSTTRVLNIAPGGGGGKLDTTYITSDSLYQVYQYVGGKLDSIRVISGVTDTTALHDQIANRFDSLRNNAGVLEGRKNGIFIPQFTLPSGGGTYTATGPITLTGSAFGIVNQGTTTQVLHGNASGNASFGSIVNGDIANSTIDLTTKVTGVLPIANGGTNNGSLSVTAGTIYYADGSKLVGLAPGTAAQHLTGGTTPSWKDTAVASGGISGSGIATRVPFWNGTGSLTSDTSFRFAPLGATSGTKIQAGLVVKNTPTALANTDTLVGIDLTQWRNALSFTGVQKSMLKSGLMYMDMDSLFNVRIGTSNGVVSTTGNSTFIGQLAGINATGASNSVFIGRQAGHSATNASVSNFIGQNAGNSASGASQSNFFGNGAGSGATNASNSNFFGTIAGQSASSATSSNFFGSGAGDGATSAANSNFFGNNAGRGGTGALRSNFFGLSAGDNAPNASNSNFFGNSAGLAALSANKSTFMGIAAGYRATGASNSFFVGESAGEGGTGASYSLFLGAHAGDSTTHNITGSNNILIGQNITTPAAASTNTANVGGVLYLNGLYSTTTGSPSKFAQQPGTGAMGIDTTAPNSTLHINGSFSAGYVAKTATYTATVSDYTIECTANTFTVTLPTAVGITGRVYNIVNSGAGTITIGTTSAQTFTNVAATPTTLSMVAVGTISVQSNGAGWIKLN